MKYQTANKTAQGRCMAQGKQSEISNNINHVNYEHCKTLAFKLDSIINKFELNTYNKKLDESVLVGISSLLFGLMK